MLKAFRKALWVTPSRPLEMTPMSARDVCFLNHAVFHGCDVRPEICVGWFLFKWGEQSDTFYSRALDIFNSQTVRRSTCFPYYYNKVYVFLIIPVFRTLNQKVKLFKKADKL